MKTREDVSVWKFTADVFKPRFSTCNTWLLLRSPAPIVSWHSSIWFPHTTPKYAFMAWLAVHNRLTTGDRMLLWNVGIEASCILCKQHLETSDHLFFSCSYSQEVWSGLVQRLLSSLFSDQWRKESWCFLRIKGSRRWSSTFCVTHFKLLYTPFAKWSETRHAANGIWSVLLFYLLFSIETCKRRVEENKCHPAQEVFKMEKQLRLTGGLDKRSDW